MYELYKIWLNFFKEIFISVGLPALTFFLGWFLSFKQTKYLENKKDQREDQKYERELQQKRNELLLKFLQKLNRYTFELIEGFNKMFTQNDPNYFEKIRDKIDTVSGQYHDSKAIIELYGSHRLNTLVEEFNDEINAVIDEKKLFTELKSPIKKFNDLPSSKDFYNKRKELLNEFHKTMNIKFN